MASVDTTAPNGWNTWIYARSTYSGIQFPDASFPYLYTPSAGFWGKSVAIHCLIPWLNTFDLMTLFLLGGGSTGTLTGSLGGLAIVGELFEVATHGQIFGIGRGAAPPVMGYCLGTKFKQHVYTRMDVQNDGMGRTIVTNLSVDLLQNSRFKRAYVIEGSVSGYKNPSPSEHILTLDISKEFPPPSGLYLKGERVEIVLAGDANNDSKTISVNVLGMKNNWDFVISEPAQEIPNGSYYRLSNPLCLEDPYLLSGFWMGSEMESNPPVISSGFNLYNTTHNSSYQEGKFLGVYIWKTNPDPSNNSSTELSSNVASSQPTVGFSMDDATGYTWAFGGFGNSKEYIVYPDDTRYREVRIEDPDSDGAIVTFKERLKVTNPDYKEFLSLKPSYIRVEIGTGGYTTRHNWYSSCLNGQYLRTGGSVFKIIDQVTFNVIDVSYISVDGKTKFSPTDYQEYSIINQYAWFLNEHYDGRISTGSNTGVFKGTVQENMNGKSFEILVDGDTFISTVKKNGLSFMDRYEQNISLSSSMIQCFQKCQGWKLVAKNGTEYNIASVDFSKAATVMGIAYTIRVQLSNATKEITNGTRVYISFGETFDTYENTSKESGFSFGGSVKAALSGGRSSGYVISNVLCMDCNFTSNPYKLNIFPTDRIGFTEGYLFGLAANGSAQSTYNQLMLFSTPRLSRGVASFFHNLREEDWAAYLDAVTGKLTIRRGSLNFTEFPMKEMISIGKSKKKDLTSSVNPIILDTTYDMLRRLWVKFKSGGKDHDLAIGFGIGSPNNIYGFYISGDGIVNLELFTIQGIDPGTMSSASFQGFDYTVSPVYLYKPNYYQNLDSIKVDVGIATKEGPIYINNEKSSVSSVNVEYINENQTLSSDIGFFDIIRFSNGENIVIYGNTPKGFTINGVVNNKGDTAWTNPRAVMSIGTFDDSFNWASPLIGRLDDKDNTNQYPLMLLNSVNYQGCIYNRLNETLALFIICDMKRGTDTFSYLGCYILSVYQMNHNRILCDLYPAVDTSRLKFFWRPPILPDSFIENASQSWTDTSNIIKDGYSFDPLSQDSMGKIQDKFIRVMGGLATHSQVTNQFAFGIISTATLNDGSYVVFYNTALGVKALFSNDSGVTWKNSNVIFARYSKCGLLIGSYVFYINSNNTIEVKNTEITDIYDARNISLMSAGNDKRAAEIHLQSTLDKRQVVSIDSGQVEPQRMSGYISPDGITKVFFYDQNNLLKCVETVSGAIDGWVVANNF